MKEPNSEVIITPQYNVTAGIDIHKDSIVTHIADRTGKLCKTKTRDTYTKTLKQISSYFITNRIVKILERGNIKIRTVASSIRTKICQSIIESLKENRLAI